MNILITGGTGFIGRFLIESLLKQQHTLVLYCRNPAKARHTFQQLEQQSKQSLKFVSQFKDIRLPINAVINLAGEPIMGKPWSPERKQQLTDSRIGLTHQLVVWLAGLKQKPTVLISGSAIGYYGNYPEDKALDENGDPRDCFASELCRAWEFEALKAKALGVRVCLVRTGVVLKKNEGALKKMWLPFLMGLGGRVGSGQQWFSWIHIDDMVQLLLFLLANTRLEGTFNATSPNPVPYNTFTRTLAKVLYRPHWLPMPSWALQRLFGESSQLLIEGQKVIPSALLDAGFTFKWNTIEEALRFEKSPSQ